MNNEIGPVYLIVWKSKRTLTLCRDGAPVRSFPIGLGRAPTGHKAREGDGRTPEGAYRVVTRNPKSKYHLSLGLNYPNEDDAARALAQNVIDDNTHQAIIAAHEADVRPPWDTPLGGFVMVHGGGATDWTEGCIALDDRDMTELYALCPIGTPIEVRP